MGWQMAQETWTLAESLGSLNKALPCSTRTLFVWEAAGSGITSKARTTRRFMAISPPFFLSKVTYPPPRWITSLYYYLHLQIKSNRPCSAQRWRQRHAVRLLHPERQP